MKDPSPPTSSEAAPACAALAALREARVALCSACLLGEPCRYDGTDKYDPLVEKALEGKQVVPICPEHAGGLPIPRPASEFVGGDGRAVLAGEARLVSREGADVTEPFRRGAILAPEAARRYGAPVAVLKQGSPSCGTRRVWIEGKKLQGAGVTAALLEQAGLALLSEEDLDPKALASSTEEQT